MRTRSRKILNYWVLCIACMSLNGIAMGAADIMNYQGKLTDNNGKPVTGQVTLVFTFWDAPVGGTRLGPFRGLLGGGGYFSDTDTLDPDSQGVCNTDIGDYPANPIPANVFTGDSVWLNVNVGGNDLLPRSHITSAGSAVNTLPRYGESYVLVRVATSSATNGTSLITAYNRAKGLAPYGQPRSATNRATVLVPPGQYDMGTGQLTMDTEFVDVVGLSTDAKSQYIYGLSNGPDTGVLRQTANDVRIENLFVECTKNSVNAPGLSSDPSAYFPDSGTTATVIRNCAFKAQADLDFGSHYGWGMRQQVNYPGTYFDVIAGRQAFGGRYGAASGTYVNCVAGRDAFGADLGSASGTFINCTGGYNSFGGYKNGATGTFIDCVAGSLSFAAGGAASGKFVNCRAGDYSFASDIYGTQTSPTASGVFENCRAGAGSFGSGVTMVTGRFTNCSAGSVSFGVLYVVNATFINCTAGDYSFGIDYEGNTAASSKFYYCSGGANSFTTNGSPAPIHRYCLRNGVPFP